MLNQGLCEILCRITYLCWNRAHNRLYPFARTQLSYPVDQSHVREHPPNAAVREDVLQVGVPHLRVEGNRHCAAIEQGAAGDDPFRTQASGASRHLFHENLGKAERPIVFTR